MPLNLALAGNPNSGKTTLFNQLTGSRAHVGNWPGVTVERREGVYGRGRGQGRGQGRGRGAGMHGDPNHKHNVHNESYAGHDKEELRDTEHYIKHIEVHHSGQIVNEKTDGVINIIDLPGIYSLSPYSPEEVVSRNYLISDAPDVVINIVDVTNLERNMYLTSQILEMEIPVVIALNMMDILDQEGGTIDTKALSKQLGVPVVEISAARNRNTDTLIDVCVEAAKSHREAKTVFEGTEYGNKIIEISDYLKTHNVKNALYSAVKLAERDERIASEMNLNTEVTNDVAGLLVDIDEITKNDPEAVSADLRYRYITSNLSPLHIHKRKDEAFSRSDKIDKIITNKFLGFPIFLLIMFLMFHLTFTENLFGLGILGPGKFLEELTVMLMDWITGVITSGLISLNASEWAISLVSDGILAGVGAVMGFVPLVLILYLCISILEDTGYMARAAFIMDRIMRRFGLSGKSFVPMIMGFGCSVPAIAATRTIENEKDRQLTIMLIPFMSCGAKIPIYGMIVPIFFKKNADLVTFGFYLLGMVVAIIAGIILKKTVFKGSVTPFIMELPEYRLPSLKSLGVTLWEKFKGFATRVGTIITVATIVIWFLSNFGFDGGFGMVEANSADSILGLIGNTLKFIFLPLGFASGPDGWKAVVAVLTGLVAKEAVVSTMGQLYSPGVMGDPLEDAGASTALAGAIAATFSIPAALSFITWNLLSTPCMAAVGAMKAEFGTNKKGFWGAMVFHFGVAWGVSFIVFAVSTLILNAMGMPLSIV